MIYYNRNYICEGIDVNKTSRSKEWHVCHFSNVCLQWLSHTFWWYYYFKLKQCLLSLYYSSISKSKVVNVLQRGDLSEKSGTLETLNS